MRKFSALLCLMGVCVVGGWLFTVDSSAGQSLQVSAREPASTGTGQPIWRGPASKAAGVFLGSATGLGEPIHFLVTLERDGIFTASDTTDFGVGGIGGLDSSYHGTWRGTGARQITTRALFFNHDTATGELVAVVRTTSAVDFDPSFTDGTGSMTIEVFAPFQVLDPLNPSTDEEPLGGTVVVDLTLARLE